MNLGGGAFGYSSFQFLKIGVTHEKSVNKYFGIIYAFRDLGVRMLEQYVGEPSV